MSSFIAKSNFISRSRFYSQSIFSKHFQFTGSLRPGVQKIQGKRPLPSSIVVPDYAESGNPAPRSSWIETLSTQDIESMRVACRLAREVLDVAGSMVREGITTDEIDEALHEACIKRNIYPSPLNYMKYPRSCCISINEVICHGIPDSTVLKNGDILNIDVTVFKDGFHGDCSEMFQVGEIDLESKKLLQVTYNAWQQAISYCKPGKPYSGIGSVIEDYVSKFGYSIVRDFCAHGIGRSLHAPPFIPHYRSKENLGIMEVGHVFTIEPMINIGTSKVVIWPDQWTAATADGKRSAQFEHTLLVTQNGVEILTAKSIDSKKQWWEKDETKLVL